MIKFDNMLIQFFIRGEFKRIRLNIQYHKLFLIKDLKYIFVFRIDTMASEHNHFTPQQV